MNNPLPSRHSSQLGAVRIDLVPGQLASAGIDVDLVEPEPPSSLPEKPADPEEHDDGQGQVGLEEALYRVEATFYGAYGDVELLVAPPKSVQSRKIKKIVEVIR